MRTIRFLLRKEYLQIFRDRTMLFEIFLVPIVQLIFLANAATFEVRSARLFVVDDDRTSTSRGLVERMTSSGRFVIAGASPSMEVASEAMLDRDASVILRIPRDFERDLVRTRIAPVQLVLDAEDGAAAGVKLSYAQRIAAAYAAELGVTLRTTVPSGISAAGEGSGAAAWRAAPALDVRARGWYNPDLDYKDYMVPGILVELVTIVGTLLTAVNIAREKEIGTLDQLNVTPVARSQFIAAKLIPLWSIALAELSVGLLVARFVFAIPMRGSLLLVFGVAAVYLIVALGIGLWISTIVETQQQAMFITFFVMMIYLLMSGLFTPVRSMPTWAQWLAQLNPVMHFVAIMRAVLLKGAGPSDIMQPFAILTVYGAVVFLFAVRQYAKRTA